ncbi:hypothetical protein [Marinobacter nauticus]|jgi:hypothetical protein|uniref:hypothetical protein n=1 Tax=Marinobacter nauticus TaxID=2743 RepID=UPI0024203A7E|nr:hypothetical protein [Marinobacter nauticus]
MRFWTGKRTVVMLWLAGLALPAWADTATPARQPSCVEVEVNGQRAPAYGCLQQKMAPAAPPRETPGHANPALDSADVTRLPPNQTGQFSQSTLRNRMGNTLGHGVKPQR